MSSFCHEIVRQRLNFTDSLFSLKNSQAKRTLWHMLITHASLFHAPGDFRARSCLSRVLCAMSSCLLPVSCEINTERTKINSHRFESRTGIIISTSNFILVPTCKIRTTFDSTGLLTNWSVWGFFWRTENRHKHQKKEIFSQKKTKWPLSRRAWNTQALRAVIK